MDNRKIRFGCPNPDCTSFIDQKKYKADKQVCPMCGVRLVHICKAKDCYTVIEDHDDVYCLSCKAKREDSAAKKKKVAAGLSGGIVIWVGQQAVRHRRKIFAVIKSLK